MLQKDSQFAKCCIFENNADYNDNKNEKAFNIMMYNS